MSLYWISLIDDPSRSSNLLILFNYSKNLNIQNVWEMEMDENLCILSIVFI